MHTAWTITPQPALAAHRHRESTQRYILREMRLLFGVTTDEESKAQITLLEKAFRGRMTKALNKELNPVAPQRREGESLLKTLANLFHQHNMRAWTDRQGSSISQLTRRLFVVRR